MKPHKGLKPNTNTAHGCRLPCALDYPWSKPSLPGSGVREASLSTADSSPQPASPSLWKVSFNHCGGGGGREKGRVVEETVGLVERGVIRHYCPSPSPAGQNVLALPVLGQRWVLRWEREEMEIPSEIETGWNRGISLVHQSYKAFIKSQFVQHTAFTKHDKT